MIYTVVWMNSGFYEGEGEGEGEGEELYKDGFEVNT